MSSRYPYWPPQRLPRAVNADWSTVGTLTTLSGSGGFTIYDRTAVATWRGKQQAITAPSTVPFVCARMIGGAGPGLTSTAEYGVYLVGSNKSVVWYLEDSTSYLYDRYAGSSWPPGAFETGYFGAEWGIQIVGPFIGLWFDRTVSPVRVRPMIGGDCYVNPTANAAPLGMFTLTSGAFGPTLSGGGVDDIGTPVSWGIALLQTTAFTGPRITVTESSQGAFYSADDSSAIEGRGLVLGSTFGQHLPFPPHRGGHRNTNYK